MKDYYTTEDAAEHLGVTRGRVLQMIAEGLIETERFGHVHMISRKALKAAEQRRTKPGPAPKAKAETSKAGKKRHEKKR